MFKLFYISSGKKIAGTFFETSSQKEMFWRTKKKLDFSSLIFDSRNILAASLKSLCFKNGKVKLFLYYQHLISMIRRNFCQSLKKILYVGFRATLNFRIFKVALNPMYRILLNFAKSCILFCLLKFDIKKKFHRAVFEI